MHALPTITIEYQKNRNNPAAIFEAMALYINFYRDFSQTIVESHCPGDEIILELESIQEGSLFSVIKIISKAGTSIPSIICDLALRLIDQLNEYDQINDSEQIEFLIEEIEKTLNAHSNALEITKINRKKILESLKKLSNANAKLLPTEEAFIGTQFNRKLVGINTAIRIPSSMTLEDKIDKPAQIPDLLIPVSTIIEGDQAWTFHSQAFKDKIRAKIIDKEWLERYQNGFIQPIGGKDTLIVELGYTIQESNKENPKADNFKVISIKDIKRGKYEQLELLA